MTNFLALIEAVTPQQAVERLGFSEGEVMARGVVAESRIKLLKKNMVILRLLIIRVIDIIKLFKV